METVSSPAYNYFKEKLLEAKANGAEVIRGKIWNMYRYEFLRRLAAKDGYTLVLKKREKDDTHIFEVIL